jgi:transposase-like protein
MKDDVSRRLLCPFCRSAMQLVSFKADNSVKFRVFACHTCSARLTVPNKRPAARQRGKNITLIGKGAAG